MVMLSHHLIIYMLDDLSKSVCCYTLLNLFPYYDFQVVLVTHLTLLVVQKVSKILVKFIQNLTNKVGTIILLIMVITHTFFQHCVSYYCLWFSEDKHFKIFRPSCLRPASSHRA